MTLDAHPDAAILGQIRSLAANLTDERAKSVVTSLLDAVALNPQPLPPDPPPEALQAIIQLVGDAVALNPQPLPPGPGDPFEVHPEPKVHPDLDVDVGPAGPG